MYVQRVGPVSGLGEGVISIWSPALDDITFGIGGFDHRFMSRNRYIGRLFLFRYDAGFWFGCYVVVVF